MPGSGMPERQDEAAGSDVLDSWKKIAVYLQRDVRTVMRWERSRQLPVHRLPGGPKSAVYALRSELEAWRAARPAAAPDGLNDASAEGRDPGSPAPVGPAAGRTVHRLRSVLWAAVAALVGFAVFASKERVGLRLPWTPRPPIRSLAVLPFENLTQDPSHLYFVDGIHDALITDLARLGGVRVISRTSVMQYRGASKAAPQIGRELDVDALVEGSVLRVGDHVRISAQLVQAASDEHVWAASYERDLRDVLGLQREVSRALAGEVRRAVGRRGAWNPAPATGLPRDVRPEAYEAYLRAQDAFHGLLSRQGCEKALSLYRGAIALEPGFALAWGGVANARAVQAFFGFELGESVVAEAREAAQRALALDENQGEALGALGFIALYLDRDFTRAGQTLERAVALSPTSTIVRHYYADYWLVKGDVEESLKQMRIARSYDPMWRTAHGMVLYHGLMARRYSEVIAEGRRAQRDFPGPWGVHEAVGRALWLQGKHEQALAEWKVLADAGDEGLRALATAYHRDGPRAALVARAEWLAARAGESQAAGAVYAATWYAAAGERDLAFAWLERSYARREAYLLHAVADPSFDPIRSDPRFAALLGRVGVTPVDLPAAR